MNTANSGLVRRRTAAEASSDNNGSSTSTSNNDHNDNFKDDAENENMEETSDKETRLTLMEEVLLLGLKDKEVSWTVGLQRWQTSRVHFRFQHGRKWEIRRWVRLRNETWRAGKATTTMTFGVFFSVSAHTFDVWWMIGSMALLFEQVIHVFLFAGKTFIQMWWGPEDAQTFVNVISIAKEIWAQNRDFCFMQCTSSLVSIALNWSIKYFYLSFIHRDDISVSRLKLVEWDWRAAEKLRRKQFLITHKFIVSKKCCRQSWHWSNRTLYPGLINTLQQICWHNFANVFEPHVNVIVAPLKM